MDCQCRVAYPGDEPQTWKLRRCRRRATSSGKCWQHAKMNPCCPEHGVERA